MAIYLGSTQISSNPTGTGKLILGTQNICKAYLGSTLIFDNCATPNSNVQLNITNNISGPSAGYTIGGDLAGFTKSGQPGASYSKFTTTASVNSGYSGSITVSDAPGGTFPSPGGTTVNATTTLSGSVTANPTTYTDTINVSKNSPNTGSFSHTTNPTSTSGVAGTNYTVTVTFTPAPHFTYSNLIATDSGSSSSVSLTSNGAGGFSGTLSYTIGNSGQQRNIVITGIQTPVLYEYDFNISENLSGTGASAVYTVTGGNNQYTNQPLSGAVTITTEGYNGDNVFASVTANLQSGYQWSVTPNPNPDATSNLKFNDGNSPVTLNVTGTAQSNPCASATTAFHASVGEPNLNSFCSITTFSTNLFYHNGTGLPGNGNVVCQGSGANKSLVNGGNNYYITGTSAFNYSGTGSFTYMRLNTSGTVTASGSYYCY